MQAWKNHEWHLWRLPCTLLISTVGGTGLCTAPSLPCLSLQSVAWEGYPTAPRSLTLCWIRLCHLECTGQMVVEPREAAKRDHWPGKQGKMKLFCYRREMAPIGRQESWRWHAMWDKPDTTGHYCGSSLTGAATTSKAMGQEGKMCAGAGEGGTDSREDSIILQVEFLPWNWTRHRGSFHVTFYSITSTS